MLIGIVTLVIVTYPEKLENDITCCLSISMAATATMASVFSIGLIAIDRYLYILHGLHYHRYITTQLPHCMVLLVWILSAVLGCLPIFLWHSPMNGRSCWFINSIPPKILLIPVAMGIIPMFLIFVLYSIILKNALHSRSRMNCSTVSDFRNHEIDLRMFRGREKITSNCADEELSSRIQSFGLLCCRSSTLEVTPLFCENKWNAVKIVAYTTGAYFITWFPYFVTCIFYACCDIDQNCENIAYLLSNPMSFLSLLNSLLNPLIYAWWHPGFRISMKKMYSRLLEKIYRKKSTTTSDTRLKIHKTSSMKQIGHTNFDNDQEIK